MVPFGMCSIAVIPAASADPPRKEREKKGKKKDRGGARGRGSARIRCKVGAGAEEAHAEAEDEPGAPQEIKRRSTHRTRLRMPRTKLWREPSRRAGRKERARGSGRSGRGPLLTLFQVEELRRRALLLGTVRH